MAKFGSTLKTLGKGAKRGGVSRIKKKSNLFSKSAKGTRKSIYGGKIKGKNILKGTGKKIGPIRPDLKEGGVRKINRLVETRVQNLVPKLSQKIEAKVDSFDPNKFMGKIFDGGLGSLRGFGDSLDGMKGSMQGTVDFLNEATEVANNFITKLAKTKQKKGGGLFGTLIKGIALAGAATLAAPAIAKVALFGGAAVGGAMLWKKGIDFIKGRFKKKKKEKKKEETKAKKAKNNLFKGVLEKFGNTLNFLNPLGKKKTKTIKENISTSSTLDGEGYKQSYNVSILNKEGRKGQIYTLKIDKHNGNVVGGPDNEVTRAITDKIDEKDDLEDRYFDNRMMGKRDDSDKAEAQELQKQIKEIKQEIRDLMMSGAEGIETQEVKKFRGRGLNLEAIVEKGEEGEKGDKGVEGKKGGLGSFIQNTTQNVKNVAGGIVKSSPTFKLAKMVQENRKAIKAQKQGGAGGMFNQLPQVKMAKWLGGKAKGIAGGIWGGIKGLFSDKEKDMKKEDSQKIAQPATQGKPGGGGSVVPIKVPAAKNDGKPPKQKQTQKEMTTPSNVIPALLAIDAQNMHTPYAKSTFNIVDAL